MQGLRSFRVVEYAISLVDDMGRQYDVEHFSQEKMEPTHTHYCILFDSYGSSSNLDDSVRFILFDGNKVVLSSLDAVRGGVYIGTAAPDGKTVVGISFSIAEGPTGKYSAFACDNDHNFVQFLRVAAMQISPMAINLNVQRHLLGIARQPEQTRI